MQEWKFSLGCHQIAWVAWLLAGLVMAANFKWPDRGLGPVATGLLAIAVTLHVRGFICQHDKNASAAFNLGREVGRQEGAEIPLQRIH